MAAYAGEVRIKTLLDTKGINAVIKQLTSSLASIGATAGKLLGAVGITVGIAALARLGQEGVKAAMQMEGAQKGLQFLTNATGRSFQTANNFVQQFIADGLVPAADAYEAYKNMVARGYDTSQIEQMLNVMKDSAVYGRQAGFEIGEAIVKTSQGLRMENSILTDSVGIQKNVAKMWDEYAKSIGTTTNKLTEAQKRQAEFNGFMAEGGVYAGAAAQYAQSYAGRVSQLGAAFYNLKVSIGNAIIPILNAIIPSIINAVNWFTRLFNTVGKVMNLIFGTSVGMADVGGQAEGIGDAAGAMGDLADNTEAAGEAAKGALAPFDKLNVLEQKTGGGGGGGAGGGVGTIIPPEEMDNIAEGTESISDKVKEMADKIKAFFAPLSESFGKLWGSIKKLWEALQPVFEIIWNRIKPAFEWLRDGAIFIIDLLTKAINWLTESIRKNPEAWANVLMVLGAILLVVIVLQGGFLGIVIVITAIIAVIGLLAANWDTIVAWFQTTLENIKQWFSDAWETIKGVWETVANWFNENVITPIKDFFKNVWDDITGFFTDAWDKISGVWNTVYGWFKEHVIDPIWGIFSWIGNTIYVIFYDLWLLIKYVWNVVSDWFKEHVIDPIVSFFKKLWEDVSGFFSNLWDDIVAIWNTVSNWFQTNVTDPIINWFQGVWTDVSGFFSSLWEDIKSIWESVSTWFQTTIIDPLVSAWQTATESIKGFFDNIWTGITDGAKTAINWIIGKLNGFLSGIVGGINGLINTWNNIPIPGWLTIAPLTVPQIPYLATGAVIPANAPFAAVLGDQRYGRNLEAPEALIRQIVREETGRLQTQVKVSFEGDLASLVRELKPHIDAETKRVGSSLITKGAVA